jgi:OmpA-OmpF porin, OOP family
MRHRFGAIVGCAMALAASGGMAHAQNFLDLSDGNATIDPVGPYVGIGGGGSFFNDVSPRGAGADEKAQFNNSYVGLGTAGWNFGNGFRAELEGGYRRSDVRGVRNGAPGSATGALGMYTVFVNGLYDIDLERMGVPSYGFIPHVGVGAGWAGARFDHAGLFNGSTLSGHQDLFAYQGIAGVDYPVAPHFKVSLDYHYVGTNGGGFHVNPGAGGIVNANTSFSDQAVVLGIRYEFGDLAPPPAPAAAPPPYTPPPAPVAQKPEPQRAFQVFFDFNKSDITSAARQVIQAAASNAKSGNYVHLVVTGHTDTVGSAKYNQGLSERRANAVKQELIADGVQDSEIATKGVGKTDLLVPTGDGVREAQNRRATIELGPNAQS